ncbi:CidA/LrgA family protein [Clostridium tarantellae]|uniref:CidA/LrgA family protein n=1 Tax=Clostridium tarantellae TaxID=39493 RepID=A0A6I1MST4_9CLOT|nr:CidA/LrgA family protein [Clostridium tarantellae]MPQ43951.1 CidA/LrgA family protein [Clostridium tarantellae]
MKLLRETLIVIAIYFIGEFISKLFIPSIPGNIIGMLILLVLLCTKIVKVEHVGTITKFFLDHLAFFFVPAGVGLLTALNLLEGNVTKLLLICILSTFIVMGVTGSTVQLLIKRKKNKKHHLKERMNL